MRHCANRSCTGRSSFLEIRPDRCWCRYVDVAQRERGLQVAANLAGAGVADERFLIDTGFDGSVWVETETMDKLLRKGVLQIAGRSKFLTASGISQSRTARGQQLEIGDHSVANPLVDEAKNGNALGLGFWSRLVVTIDFPKQKLYLPKGEQYSRADYPDVSGLHILRRSEVVIVDSVDTGSPGATAGVRLGDILVQAGKFQGEAPLFQLRAALREPGAVPCAFQRGKTESRVTLTIPNCFEKPSDTKP